MKVFWTKWFSKENIFDRLKSCLTRIQHLDVGSVNKQDIYKILVLNLTSKMLYPNLTFCAFHVITSTMCMHQLHLTLVGTFHCNRHHDKHDCFFVPIAYPSYSMTTRFGCVSYSSSSSCLTTFWLDAYARKWQAFLVSMYWNKCLLIIYWGPAYN